jgi:hypothetical protein
MPWWAGEGNKLSASLASLPCPGRVFMVRKYEMVGVAQSVEHRVVAPAVAGSSPVAHPNDIKGLANKRLTFFISSP